MLGEMAAVFSILRSMASVNETLESRSSVLSKKDWPSIGTYYFGMWDDHISDYDYDPSFWGPTLGGFGFLYVSHSEIIFSLSNTYFPTSKNNTGEMKTANRWGFYRNNDDDYSRSYKVIASTVLGKQIITVNKLTQLGKKGVF